MPLHFLGKRRARDNQRVRPLGNRRAFSPRHEILEDRTVLSPLTVSNSLDTGPGSLRQAIVLANTTPGPDTIIFAKTVHKITLTGGELVIADDLQIQGPGSNKLTISGNQSSRVFRVDLGATSTITGLTIADGLAGGTAPGLPSSGGGLLNQGSLTLDDVVVNGNRAVGDPTVVVSTSPVFNSIGGAVGGGIANFGTLIAGHCTFTGNQALGADMADGSSYPFSFPGNALGGGLDNHGFASVTDTQFAGNLAQAGSGGTGDFAGIGGGGAILNDATMIVIGSSFRDNQAIGGDNNVSTSHNGHALGGGIMSGTLLALVSAGSASLMVDQSTFDHNEALGGNDNHVAGTVPMSEAPDNGYGGGIAVYQGSAAVQSSTLTHNRAVGGIGGGNDGKGSLGVGGGIFFYNFVGGVTATVAGSTITDNQAIGGAGRTGIAGGNGLGGGIAIGGLGSPYSAPGSVDPGPGSVDISDTTIARNLAQGGDGGKGADGGDGLGGGLYNDGSSNLVLTTSTVTHNRAKGGHGKAGGRAGQGLGDNIF